MKKLVFVLFALASVSTFASTLIECEGIDNPNIGLIKILTNKEGNQAQKLLVSYFDKGTMNHHLSNVAVDLSSKKIIDHVESNGTRFSVIMSDEVLTDGSNTIRPYFFKSQVYFELPGLGTVINSRYLKCRRFDHF